MSCFIVEYTTINRIAHTIYNDYSSLATWAKEQVIHAAIDTGNRFESPQSQIATALYQLNAKSVNARYPNHPQNDLEYIGYSKNYAPLTLGGLIKKLDSYLYQIEGEALEKSPLHLTLTAYRDCKVGELLETTPDYKNEDWG